MSTTTTNIPPGTIVPWLGGAGYTPPSGFTIAQVGADGYAAAAAPGWVYCDGREVLISLYPALYAAIGTTYGGSATTFYLPGSGRYLVGASAMAAGNATSSHSHTITSAVQINVSSGGAHSHTMSTSSWTAAGNHSHTTSGNTAATGSVSGRVLSNTTGLICAANDHSHYYSGTTSDVGAHTHGGLSWSTDSVAAHNHTVNNTTNAGTNSYNAGALTSTSSYVNPPYLGLWHIIKT